MSMHQYIGARYVPRFMGTYDNTQQYENLDVVDNGLGTSYIAKIPTPPGTPLTDTTHWALYGASSGAIINLQNQIDTINNTDLPAIRQEITNVESLIGDRKFILLGDSFGYGITPPDYGSVNGVGWIKHFVQTVGQYCDTYYADVSVLPGVAGFASSLTFKTMIQSLSGTITDPDSITDIVVLGGSNDVYSNGVTEADLMSAIEDFIDYCRTTYKNAHVKIGVLSTQLRLMASDTAKPFACYKRCTEFGAEFMPDAFGLYCIPSTIAADTVHLTQAGYTYYTPYINNLILAGHTSYMFNFEIALTADTSQVSPSTALTLVVHATEKYRRLSLRDTNYTGGFIAIVDRNYTARKTFVDCFTLASNLHLPELYNTFCGGNLGIKDNVNNTISMCSTWRVYTNSQNKLSLQIDTPVANAHPNDNNYVTVCFFEGSHECIVSIG